VSNLDDNNKFFKNMELPEAFFFVQSIYLKESKDC